MHIQSMPGLLLVATVTIVGLSAGCEDDIDTAGEVLEASQREMSTRSFSIVDKDCATCPPPTVMEYAPPDTVRLSDSKGHDDWPYALLLGGRPYVSSAGKRWLTETASLQFVGMRLSDPRVLLVSLKEPQLQPAEEVGGRSAEVVSGELDIDRFLVSLPPSFRRPETERLLREFYEGAVVRLWTDANEHTVLQLEFDPRGDEPHELVLIDYTTPVDLPEQVESMPFDDAHRFAEPVEKAGERLLLAIAEYRASHGSYPPTVDPSTLAPYIPPGSWPTNPFSGQPLRQSSDTPGDFDYLVLNGGEHMQFTICGWDNAQLHYDSARWGHQDPDHLRQQRR